jgi:hypothetical protein
MTEAVPFQVVAEGKGSEVVLANLELISSRMLTPSGEPPASAGWDVIQFGLDDVVEIGAKEQKTPEGSR